MGMLENKKKTSNKLENIERKEIKFKNTLENEVIKPIQPLQSDSSIERNINIKVSKELKANIEAIKIANKLKFDYQALELIINYYKNNVDEETVKKIDTIVDFTLR